MTRAEWYALNGNGRWRKARKAFQCGHKDKHGLRCQTEVQSGEEYFDSGLVKSIGTNSYTLKDYPITLRMCFACASEKLNG